MMDPSVGDDGVIEAFRMLDFCFLFCLSYFFGHPMYFTHLKEKIDIKVSYLMCQAKVELPA
jgi:hypothetical protein